MNIPGLLLAFTLISILGIFLSIILGIIGLVNPKLLKIKSRPRVLLIFGGSIVVLICMIISFLLLMPTDEEFADSVETAIAETQALWTAIPTSTDYPTHTPYPTYTEIPTYTPAVVTATITFTPSISPTITLTSSPTLTPFPTKTSRELSNITAKSLGCRSIYSDDAGRWVPLYEHFLIREDSSPNIFTYGFITIDCQGSDSIACSGYDGFFSALKEKVHSYQEYYIWYIDRNSSKVYSVNGNAIGLTTGYPEITTTGKGYPSKIFDHFESMFSDNWPFPMPPTYIEELCY